MLAELKYISKFKQKKEIEAGDYERNKIDVLSLAQPGPQYKFLSTNAEIAFYGGAAGGGKLLPLDTKIPTPSGWTTMGEVKVGDKLFDEKGKICSIEHVFDIEEKPILYRLIFDDGFEIDACEHHLWRTFDAKELASLTKCNENYREKRRLNRKSRANPNSNKSTLFLEKLLKRNKEIKNIKTETIGTIRTTKEIIDSLYLSNKRTNHAIPVCNYLDIPQIKLPIDPYLLGLWLGDGTSTTGCITTADNEITTKWTKINSSKYGWRVEGLTTSLREIGVLGNKHVPKIYFRSSREQRLELLKGLMDTDGTVTNSGSVEFDNTNEKLIDAVIELACSLGHKPGKKCKSRATLYGVDCGPKWSIKWTAPEYVFNLERKKNKQKLASRRVTKFRYIVNAYLIDSRPGRCISVSSESRLFLAGERMIPTHNSYALLLEHLKNSHNPKFRSLIFRRTSVQVRSPGGLWDESMAIYMKYKGHPRAAFLDWTFPSGSVLKFSHLEHEKSVFDWQGSQIPFIGFDEITHFSESQFTYMMSRNRSTSGVKPYMRATCNPDVNSWVREWVDWYIDANGFAIPERSGIIRWFIRKDGLIHWANSKDEIFNEFGKDVQPKSFTFISAKITDNKILMDKDPSYIANLQALSRVERDRLLGANWNVKVIAGSYFQEQWFETIDVIPHGWIKSVRYWDRAASEVSEENKDPDWTRGLKMLKYPNGIWIVVDLKSLRGTPLEVERLIKNTASLDGFETIIYGEEDPGSAGKSDIGNFVRMLAGYYVQTVRNTKDKETRAKPVSAQSEAGNIKILRANWNKEFFNELENFPMGKHDDIVDVFSGAFNALSENYSSFDAL